MGKSKTKYLKKNILLFLIAVVILMPQKSSAFQQYSKQIIGVDDGLPTYRARSLTIDNNAFVWIATDDGLARYNGQNIDVFKSALPSRYVKYTLSTSDNRLLVATDLGLVEIFRDRDSISIQTLIPGSESLTDSTLFYPKSIYEDHSGQIWITEPNGIVRLKNETKFVRYEFDNIYRSSGTYIRTFFPTENSENELYLAAETGALFYFDKEKDQFQLVNNNSANRFNELKDLLFISDYLLWAATDTGIYEFDTRIPDQPWNRIYEIPGSAQLSKMPSGDIIVATSTQHFYHINSRNLYNSLQVFIPNQSSNLNFMTIDSDLNIWATTDLGVYLLYPMLFESVDFPKEHENVIIVHTSADGNYFAASDQTLYHLRKNEFDQFQPEIISSLTSGRFLAITSNEDYMWYSTTNGQIIKTENNREVDRFSIFTEYENFDIHPYYMLLDQSGNLWVLTYNIPVVLKITPDNQVIHYDMNDQPVSITESSDGDIYIGAESYSDILLEYNASADTFFPLENASIDTGNILFTPADITTDTKGNIWVAGNTGIFKYDGTSIFMPEGLEVFNDRVATSITADKENNIWIGAYNGLSVFRDGTVTLFDTNDGIPSLSLRSRSISVDQNGYIWVGTALGIGRLTQKISDQNKTPDPMVLVDEVTGELIQQNEFSVTVREGSNLTLSFLSLSYPQEKISYLVDLTQGDLIFNQNSSSNNIQLQRLSTGVYEFSVKGQKRGAPKSSAISYSVIVQPHWYKTSWAYTAYFIFFGLIFYLFITYNIQKSSKRRTETRLQQTEEQLSNLLRISPIILLSIDKNGEIVIAEGNGLQIAHIDPSGLLGKNYTTLFSKHEHKMMFQDALKNDTSHTFVWHQDSNSFQFEVFSSEDHISNNDPEFVHFLGFDITERVKAQNEIIEAKNNALDAKKQAEFAREKAIKADKAKSQFLANMSHELRTPLNAILGFSQILKRDKQLSEKHKEYVDIMLKSGEHLLNMINEILDLSKIESGKTLLKMEPCDLHVLMDNVAHLFQVQATNKGLELNFNYKELPQSTLTDPNKLKQILINLIGNAIKFTDSGTVNFTAKKIISDEGRELLRFEIRDTGKGIPEHFKDQIFKPFLQVEDQSRKGTGLGLTISYQLVKLLEGDIDVQSTLGEGSQFTFHIPYYELDDEHIDEAQVLMEDSREIIGTKGSKVWKALIVDDVSENRELVAALLNKSGFLCTQASNGLEALNEARTKSFDVIVMDIIMPVLDGKDALSKIRLLPGYSDIPVIAITASGFEEKRKNLLNHGFDSYIRKPFEINILFDEIERLCDVHYIYESNSPSVEKSEAIYLDELARIISDTDEATFTKIKDAIELMDIPTLENILQKQPLSEDLANFVYNIFRKKSFRFLMELDERIEDLRA